MKQFPLFLIFLGTFFTVGCTSPTEFPLSETHVIQGFGYSIDYPAGWLATTEDTVTFITQKEEDFNKRYFENFVPVGIFIGFDHRDLAFLTELGLPVYEPTLNDLFQLNIDKLTGMTNPKIEKTTLFGVNAL